MDDLTIRWEDPVRHRVHLLTAHDVRSDGTYNGLAETACGIAVAGTLFDTDDDLTCGSCLSREGGPAVQEAERILARALVWRSAPARMRDAA